MLTTTAQSLHSHNWGRNQEVHLYERTAWGLRYKTKTSITLGAVVSPKSPQGPGK